MKQWKLCSVLTRFRVWPGSSPQFRSAMRNFSIPLWAALVLILATASIGLADDSAGDTDFFERRIRPILVEHCYACHSEDAQEQQGGLLLDRQSGWLAGGNTNAAVVPGEPEVSLLITAVRYDDENLQMPPDGQLDRATVQVLEQWVRMGAPGPRNDRGDTAFSRLGDQEYLFGEAASHWSFQPVAAVEPPDTPQAAWNYNSIDRFVWEGQVRQRLSPSAPADSRTLIRRLYFDLTGLPPLDAEVDQFVRRAAMDRPGTIRETIDALMETPAYGHHIARLWLDVARYADTDSAYRPDTRTPHYFPFAFTYRDYVIASFNDDKPFDQFIKEQLAADLMGFDADAPELAALGFLAVGPHANRAPNEALDDWIDLTTRGLMGISVACARCHDHKYEPIPTADYYALRGVFAALTRPSPLDEKRQPLVSGYEPAPSDFADYHRQRKQIDTKIAAAAGKKARGNNRPVAVKIRETELAQLLLFHPGAPARAMVVLEKPRPPAAYVHIRGDATARGEPVPRRFLKIIDPVQPPFPDNSSGRLQLAEKIVDPQNPLTARVFVNRVWGQLIGSHLVDTPSDFGLQGAPPTHPELLDWLTADFMAHQWSVKHLVRSIVSSQTYQQSSEHRNAMAAMDPQNRQLWRANRKHLSIEAMRDAMLMVSGELDLTPRGRAAELWGPEYTRRRAIYGYINRFNLDPTLRAFDFPSPMQTQPHRGESIVSPQALFTMNSPFVIDQALAVTLRQTFVGCDSDEQRVEMLFRMIFQRLPAGNEVTRALKFVEAQNRLVKKTKPSPRFIESPWPLIAQALLMSNEFQYLD